MSSTPLSKNKSTCLPISSDCVIYEGPKLCSLPQCEHESISEVIYKLEKELSYYKSLLDLSTLDLGTLILPGDGKRTPVNVLQAIINQIQ